LKTKFLRCILILLPAVMAAVTTYAREDHKAYREMKLPECAECHQGSGIPPNHGGGWLKEHKVLASRINRNCFDCHDQGTCQDCHKGGGISSKSSDSQWKRDVKPETHRTDWVSIHPIQASSNPQNCSRCHEPQFCASCHGRMDVSSLTIRDHAKSGGTQAYIGAFPDLHAAEARRNLASCQACHPDGNVCMKCHSAKIGAIHVNPHPKNFKADRIGSRSNNRSCVACH
jgi:mono/diheme cytochrome c family protein